MAAYCAERTIRDAIESLKSQTYKNWECIIVDDASKDLTIDKAQECIGQDDRFILLRSETNGGPSASRNLGIRAARGSWVTVLDADDEFTKDRLERLVRLSHNGEYDLLFDNLAPLASGPTGQNPYWPRWTRMPTSMGLTEIARCHSWLTKSPSYSFMKPFFRRKFAEQHQVQYDEQYRSGEDILFAFSLILAGARVGRCATVGYLYREPDPNSITNASKINQSHSIDVTSTILTRWKAELSIAQKFWLHARLLNLSAISSARQLKQKITDRRYLSACHVVLKNPWIICKQLLCLYVVYIRGE